ncbi:MAG: hypothetical protein HY537_06430 [Deltaproteobacteria bacterium]|nr:hypothetical protein [Deltaproteobacteria bacterium]
MNMSKGLATVAWGVAIVIGGLYLYKKYGGKRSDLVGHAAGMALGHEIGGTAGHLVAGPVGMVVGGAVGAAAGVMAAEDYLGD